MSRGEEPDILEISWYGRGGQGVVTAAQILVWAAMLEGKYGMAIPFFGAERRGAPVIAYNRISSKPILVRGSVKKPNIAVVVDSSLIGIFDPFNVVRDNGYLIFNSVERPEVGGRKNVNVSYVDAVKIALDIGLVIAGIPLVNMPMLGALAAVTEVVNVDSIVQAVPKVISSKVEENIEAVKRGAREVKRL